MNKIVLLSVVCELALTYGMPRQHECIHDMIAERRPYIVNMGEDGGTVGKRQATADYSNIRIHAQFVDVHPTVTSLVQSPNGSVFGSIETLERILMVHPVQGNLIIPPSCEYYYTSGANRDKCSGLIQSSYSCGELAVVPSNYVGVIEVCSSANGPCSFEGPNGTGIPDSDFLLFVSASSTNDCRGGTLAYASTCMLDSNSNNRPVAGYINICPSSLEDFRDQPTLAYNLILHEIMHALGFSSGLFDWFVDENGNNYSPSRSILSPYGTATIFTGPKTVELARLYYSCDSLAGLLLENEGGSGTASSHWEKRTLHNEIMNGFTSVDYEILSELSIAFFEDTGWYKANYTVLSELNQNSLQWGKGQGCLFLNERCDSTDTFPYLCDENIHNDICTYDHLSKGNCSSSYSGFDGCPVALADSYIDYCRTDLDVVITEEVENYGSDSICVDGVQSSSYTCGTYVTKSAVALCLSQTTYTVNNTDQYVLYLEGEAHACRDDHALIAETEWVVFCPPTDEVAQQTQVVEYNELPNLSPSSQTAVVTYDNFENVVISPRENVVAFGFTTLLTDTIKQLHINSFHYNAVPLCHLSGCMTCTRPLEVENNMTLVIDADNIIFSAMNNLLTVTVVFTNTESRSTGYTLLLMLDPLAEHSFIYYAVSIDLTDANLQSNVIYIMAITSSTEVRIAPSKDVNINGRMVLYGEEYISLLDIGETVTVVSSNDLTGSRVTTSKAASFYSGQTCRPGQSSNCSLLLQQIPPYNSWGNSFILYTNISDGLTGDKFKIVASDTGANVLLACTDNGVVYDHNNITLDFRQHSVLTISQKYCMVQSDENILVLQFQSNDLADMFSTVVSAEIHYKNYYVFNAFENFISIAALTIKTENFTIVPLLLDDSMIEVDWEQVELDGDIFSFATLTLSAGRHTLTFSENNITFGAILYGVNRTDTHALPADMTLDLTMDLPFQAPSAVQEALITLVDREVNITWSPPAIPNGAIHQYVLQRINASGKFFEHIAGNLHTTTLPHYSDALVFIAAINLYGQSLFEHAKPKEPCLPSPCINGGRCTVESREVLRCNCSSSFTGVYCETAIAMLPTETPTVRDSDSGSDSSTGELVIVIAASVTGAAVFLIIFGAVVGLHIRKKLIHRAKIVDISHVSKSIAAQDTRSSLLKTQFMVKNSDKAVYYINFPQSPLNSENGVEETAN